MQRSWFRSSAHACSKSLQSCIHGCRIYGDHIFSYGDIELQMEESHIHTCCSTQQSSNVVVRKTTHNMDGSRQGHLDWWVIVCRTYYSTRGSHQHHDQSWRSIVKYDQGQIWEATCNIVQSWHVLVIDEEFLECMLWGSIQQQVPATVLKCMPNPAAKDIADQAPAWSNAKLQVLASSFLIEFMGCIHAGELNVLIIVLKSIMNGKPPTFINNG